MASTTMASPLLLLLAVTAVGATPQDCALRKDRGSCSAFEVRWYYDTEYGGCLRFWYGGCDGNGNRFSSEAECRSQCVSPSGDALCHLPAVRGACKRSKPRWFSDPASGSCRRFTYSGCLGNDNQFESEQACQERCRSALGRLPPPPEPEPEPQPGGSSAADCQLPAREAGSCAQWEIRYSWLPARQQCAPFYYGGCDGNANNFASRELCESVCKAPPAEAPERRRPAQPDHRDQSRHQPTQQPRGYQPSTRPPYYRPAATDAPYYLPESTDAPYYRPESTEAPYYRPESTEAPYYRPESTDAPYYRPEQTDAPYYRPEQTDAPYYRPEQTDAPYYRPESTDAPYYRPEQTDAPYYRPEQTDAPYYRPEQTDAPYYVPDSTEAPYYERPTESPYYEPSVESRFNEPSAPSYGAETTESPYYEQPTEYPVEPQESMKGEEQDMTADVCSLPPDQGDCRANKPQFYYNSALQSCFTFYYGGCGGNGNRFSSVEECQRRCQPDAVATTRPAPVVTDARERYGYDHGDQGGRHGYQPTISSNTAEPIASGGTAGSASTESSPEPDYYYNTQLPEVEGAGKYDPAPTSTYEAAPTTADDYGYDDSAYDLDVSFNNVFGGGGGGVSQGPAVSTPAYEYSDDYYDYYEDEGSDAGFGDLTKRRK